MYHLTSLNTNWQLKSKTCTVKNQNKKLLLKLAIDIFEVGRKDTNDGQEPSIGFAGFIDHIWEDLQKQNIHTNAVQQ